MTDRYRTPTRRSFLATTLGLAGGVSLLSGTGAATTLSADHSLSQGSSASSAKTSASWPQFQGGSGHAGYAADQQAPVANFTPEWSLWPQMVGEPVIKGDTIYAVTAEPDGNDPWLKSLSRSDGSTRWHVPINNDSAGASADHYLAVVDGVVYYSSGVVTRAVDAATGDQHWVADATGRGLTVADDRVYLEGDSFDVLDCADGSVVWERDLDGIVYSHHAVADDTLYLSLHRNDANNDTAHAVVALDAATGEQLWRTELDDHYPRMVATETMVLAATERTLYALNPHSGAIRWQKQGGPLEPPEAENVSPPVVTEDVVYAPIDERVYALDVTSGKERWATDKDAFNGAPPRIAVSGDVLYTIDSYSSLVTLETATGTVIDRYEHTGDGSIVDECLAPVEGSVYVGVYGYVETNSIPSTTTRSLVALSGESRAESLDENTDS